MRFAGYLLLSLAPLWAQQTGPADLARRAVEEHRRGDLPSAVRDYRELLQAHPEYTKVRTNLAAALSELGQIDETIAVLEAAPGMERSKSDVRRGLALAYYRKQNIPAAIAELEKVHAGDPSDASAVGMLADCYMRSNQAGKASALLAPAVKAHPQDALLKYQYGSALVRSGKIDPGIEVLEEAGRIGNSADAYLLAGATLLDAGQFQRAAKDLEQVIRINPNIPGAWTWTGAARDRISDEEGAKAAFHKALEADPRDFEANFHLGAILYRERELPQARKYLEQAVQLQPSSLLARYAIALVRSATGETDQAVRDLESVTAASPNWVEPHVKLASLYFRLHRQADGQKEKQIVDTLRAEHKEQVVTIPALDPQ